MGVWGRFVSEPALERVCVDGIESHRSSADLTELSTRAGLAAWDVPAMFNGRPTYSTDAIVVVVFSKTGPYQPGNWCAAVRRTSDEPSLLFPIEYGAERAPAGYGRLGRLTKIVAALARIAW